MTRAIALAFVVALAAVTQGCGKYGAPVRYRPAPAAEAAATGSGTVPAPSPAAPAGDEEAPPAPTATPVPAEPKDPVLEPAPSWQP